MFCFQCEQTAGCKSCAGNVGVCGKKADTAELQDKLTGALIGLARATEGNEHVVSNSTAAVIVEGLFATLTNVNFDNDSLLAIMERVDIEKRKLVPECYKCASSCGKYRFNDLDLGTIGGLPRLMDIGQCNDAYSAIQIAVALADTFGCGVNDLPLSMVLSWYEQKTVCILLTLLHLGIKNIRIGPTLPAFVSPNVLNFLVEKFNITPITTPERDLKAILG